MSELHILDRNHKEHSKLVSTDKNQYVWHLTEPLVFDKVQSMIRDNKKIYKLIEILLNKSLDD